MMSQVLKVRHAQHRGSTSLTLVCMYCADGHQFVQARF
jgi:hypothetical protein